MCIYIKTHSSCKFVRFGKTASLSSKALYDRLSHRKFIKPENSLKSKSVNLLSSRKSHSSFVKLEKTPSENATSLLLIKYLWNVMDKLSKHNFINQTLPQLVPKIFWTYYKKQFFFVNLNNFVILSFLLKFSKSFSLYLSFKDKVYFINEIRI